MGKWGRKNASSDSYTDAQFVASFHRWGRIPWLFSLLFKILGFNRTPPNRLQVCRFREKISVSETLGHTPTMHSAFALPVCLFAEFFAMLLVLLSAVSTVFQWHRLCFTHSRQGPWTYLPYCFFLKI